MPRRSDAEQLTLELIPGHLHPEGLAQVGLAPGDRVRFRRRLGGRWVEGTALSRHRDGSIALHEDDGRARAIRADQLEVSRAGPRGGRRWVRVVHREERR